jgi:hypothetical protein
MSYVEGEYCYGWLLYGVISKILVFSGHAARSLPLIFTPRMFAKMSESLKERLAKLHGKLKKKDTYGFFMSPVSKEDVRTLR